MAVRFWPNGPSPLVNAPVFFALTGILFSEGAKLLVSQIDRVRRRERGTPQTSAGSYQSWPTRAEIRSLRTNGGSLIRLCDLTRIPSSTTQD
jgi:hypothetical protein